MIKINEKDIIIMQLVADGHTALEISEKTGASSKTIEKHVLSLKKDLNCKSITHLAITLLRAGVIK